MTFPTILTILHRRHEHPSATLRRRTLSPQSLNRAIPIHLVVLQHGELRLLALVLDFLGRGVHLLLSLFGHTAT